VQSAHIHNVEYFEADEIHSLSDCVVCHANSASDSNCSSKQVEFLFSSDCFFSLSPVFAQRVFQGYLSAPPRAPPLIIL
jgi:hypothetical protein